MKTFIEKRFRLDELKNIDIQQVGSYYYYFDELEWREFVNDLMDHKKYDYFLVILFNSRWNGASGFKIFNNYYDCFFRDYDCSMYVKGGSVKGKSMTLTEYHHDAPTGHTSVIIGLTEAEHEKICNSEIDEVLKFGEKYII